MNGDQLGQKYFEHLIASKAPPMQTGETYSYLYGMDEVLIDREKSVLHFPDIGQVGFEPNEEDTRVPEWIALIVTPAGDSDLVPGYCDPFGEEAMEILPHVGGAIRAIPYWVKKRLHEPRVQRMLQKYAKAGRR